MCSGRTGPCEWAADPGGHWCPSAPGWTPAGAECQPAGRRGRLRGALADPGGQKQGKTLFLSSANQPTFTHRSQPTRPELMSESNCHRNNDQLVFFMLSHLNGVTRSHLSPSCKVQEHGDVLFILKSIIKNNIIQLAKLLAYHAMRT